MATARSGAILFVEDNVEDFVIAHRQLRDCNVSNPVRCVPTAHHLTRYLEGSGDYADRDLYPLPAVIVMDLRLPEVDGLQAQAWVRSKLKFRKIPIIAISSEEQVKVLRSAVTLGADAFLLKPFKAREFFHLAEQKNLPVDYKRA
ncbi:MAG: response regulator with CheY-like receiver domain and winged-helix DNA-binding domain [Verrucomicrobiales bacterium]|nr:response regulator with CheY-like receiver domain and winged-helix DNA-binding domain [Verrucomicrobiales bacterium]